MTMICTSSVCTHHSPFVVVFAAYGEVMARYQVLGRSCRTVTKPFMLLGLCTNTVLQWYQDWSTGMVTAIMPLVGIAKDGEGYV